jgi:cytochrome c peroxidase
MGKEQRINKPKWINFLSRKRSKNNTSPFFSLRWYGLLIGIGAIMLVMYTVFGYAAAKSNSGGSTDIVLSDIELLGKYVFFDKISNPPRMACVTCHAPENGGTFGIAGVNLHQVAVTGADPHTAGNRKPPTNAYATFIRPFSPAKIGGNFWDGRSVGFGGSTTGNHTEVIGTTCIDSAPLTLEVKNKYKLYLGPTADQALNPFPNPVEQNIVEQGVCQHVASSKYAKVFEKAWGETIYCGDVPYKGTGFNAYQVNYRRIAVSLSAYQASGEVNSFSSRLDQALKYDQEFNHENPPLFPLTLFTTKENEGHNLFYQNCALFCHNSGSIGQNRTDVGERYASDIYINIGTPANPEIPGFDPGNPDLGLFNHTQQANDKGLFKIPTMRNVDKRSGVGFTKAYSHNGWFKSLESIVHFYNTRDVLQRCPEGVTTEKDALKANCWPAPEVEATIFKGGPFGKTGFGGIGNLGLTPEDEAKIVAYLETLTDTYTPKAPEPYK